MSCSISNGSNVNLGLTNIGPETHPLTWRYSQAGKPVLDLATYESMEGYAALKKTVLAGSSLLNAAYFLPLLYRAWLLPPPPGRPAIAELATTRDRMLILPAVVTAVVSLGAGIFASLSFSPLGWATLVGLGYLR